MSLVVGIELQEVSQIVGADAQIGIQLSVAPETGQIVVGEGKEAYVQVSFELNGLYPTTISQKFVGANGTGTIIDSNNPLLLEGLYYPGQLVTYDTRRTIIQYPTAKIFIQQ